MEDPKAQEILEKWISRLSNGEVGHRAEAEATKGLTLVKLLKGSVLCEFIVHSGVSDEHGKWHDGAMATLVDIVGSWAAFSVTSQHQITVSLSVSCYSKPNLQEVIEVEGKAMGKMGKMTSVIVEVRSKHDEQMVALAIMWMAPYHSHSSNNNKPLPSKL